MFEGEEDLDVKGEPQYQNALVRTAQHHPRQELVAVLAPEPDSPYDAGTVAVWVYELKVGYLAREGSPDIDRRFSGSRIGKTAVALMGQLVGGGAGMSFEIGFGMTQKTSEYDVGMRDVRFRRNSNNKAEC